MDIQDRQPQAAVHDQFLDRWSPRAFAPQPLTEEEIASLFEAARWAPSAGNIQPWFFLCAVTEEERRLFCSLLDQGNQRWACAAPLLIFLLSRRNRPSGKANDWALFDAGAAWMSLALQARHLGLHAHAMAGFDREAAHTALGVDPETFVIAAAIAVGRRDDPSSLPPDLQEREKPTTRRPLQEVFRQGRLS